MLYYNKGLSFVRKVILMLTNLGAGTVWLKLFRLISFPPCAVATSLRAMKKPYESGKREKKKEE